MAFLKFLNSEKVYECKVTINANVVTLKFISENKIKNGYRNFQILATNPRHPP